MSSSTSIAAAAAAASQAQLQMALAAEIAKMNAAQQQSMVDLIEASAEQLQEQAKAAPPPGIGEAVDISA